MKPRFRYILYTLILLSLIVLGENILISCPTAKFYKETEWLITSNTKVENSTCYYSNQYIVHAAIDSNIQFWSIEHILYYNQNVAVAVISQTNLSCEIGPFYLLNNRSYIPRKSLEHHYIS